MEQQNVDNFVIRQASKKESTQKPAAFLYGLANSEKQQETEQKRLAGLRKAMNRKKQANTSDEDTTL